MKNDTITINKSTVIVAGAVVLAGIIFLLGMLTTIGINHHQSKVRETYMYESQMQLKYEKEASEKEAHLQELRAVSPNMNRDLQADVYAIKIAAISEVAGEYKQAEMSNLLNDPEVRVYIYQELEKVIDEKTQEYLDIYKLATEAALLNYNEVTDRITPTTDTNIAKQLEYNARTNKFLEKEWEDYNATTLKNLSNDLKNDLGNKLLKGENIL